MKKHGKRRIERADRRGKRKPPSDGLKMKYHQSKIHREKIHGEIDKKIDVDIQHTHKNPPLFTAAAPYVLRDLKKSHYLSFFVLQPL